METKQVKRKRKMVELDPEVDNRLNEFVKKNQPLIRDRRAGANFLINKCLDEVKKKGAHVKL